MFSGVLTGTSQVHGYLHGLLLIDKLKTLSIFANSLSDTPIPPHGIKGFTGLIPILYNKTERVDGLTPGTQTITRHFLTFWVLSQRNAVIDRDAVGADNNILNQQSHDFLLVGYSKILS